MCKYHNRLFVFTFLVNALILPIYVNSRPPDKKKSFFGYFDGNDDYDMHFDQRQNGTENIRLSIDGVMIAVPSEALFEPSERLIDELDIAEILSYNKNLEKKLESRNSNRIHATKENSKDPDDLIKEQPIESIKLDENKSTENYANAANDEHDNLKKPTLTVIDLNHLKSLHSSGEKRNKSKYRFLNLLQYLRRNPHHD